MFEFLIPWQHCFVLNTRTVQECHVLYSCSLCRTFCIFLCTSKISFVCQEMYSFWRFKDWAICILTLSILEKFQCAHSGRVTSLNCPRGNKSTFCAVILNHYLPCCAEYKMFFPVDISLFWFGTGPFDFQCFFQN